MSWTALAWAGKQRLKRAADKLVLIALADRHNDESGLSYPSVAWLAEFSCLDRKTVIASIDRLEALGLVSDSGQRVGKTGQVKAYNLNISGTFETVPETEQFQKRNSSTFSGKQSQKRDTEPSLEPSLSTEAKASSESKARKRVDAFPCPVGVDPIDWEALKANRKAKRAALTEGAHRQITTKLERWDREGWPPGPIVAHAAERGWTTVFETDEMKELNNGGRNGIHGKPRQEGADRRDGIARALDRRLGLDDAPGPFGRRDAGPSESHRYLAAPAADPLF